MKTLNEYKLTIAHIIMYVALVLIIVVQHVAVVQIITANQGFCLISTSESIYATVTPEAVGD